MSALRNWAGNVTFQARALHRPSTIDEVAALVAGSDLVRVLGSGHSFSPIADTTGDLISLAEIDPEITIDAAASTVTAGSAVTVGELGAALHAQGWALRNTGSLPHIAIGGAIATGTHGSGAGRGNLATQVAALQLIDAAGELRHVDRCDPAFAGMALSIGLLGVVTRVTLEIVPTFQVRQYVSDSLTTSALDAHLDEILESAYSVSIFTTWSPDGTDAIWQKVLDVPDGPAHEVPGDWGVTPADGPRHCVPGAPIDAVTQQLGVPGPWHERLPHFRQEFTPSSGDELQSEYLIGREDGVAAIAAVRAVSADFRGHLLISELRTVAADELWISHSYRRDSLAFHFTWRPDADVTTCLGAVERALAPFAPRPHWGKVFLVPAAELPARYPRWDDFVGLVARSDPHGTFANDVTTAWGFRGGA